MNRKQRKILNFLFVSEPSKFFTQDEISKQTNLFPKDIGTECYKLAEIQFLERDVTEGEKIKYRITGHGSNYVEQEKHRKKTLSWMTIGTLSTIGLLIVTGILAYSTFILANDSQKQTSLFEEDFDVNNRPWIAGYETKLNGNTMFYNVQNYGSIPNIQGTVKSVGIIGNSTEHPLNKSEIPKEEFSIQPLAVIMPSQQAGLVLKSDFTESIEHALNTDGFFQIVIILNYTYGHDKYGETGYSGIFNPDTNDFENFETWAK